MEHGKDDAMMTNSIQHGGEGGLKRKDPDEESEGVVAHEQEEEAQPSTSDAARPKKKKIRSDEYRAHKNKVRKEKYKEKRQVAKIAREAEERAKPKFFPNDDALGEKKYQIKVVGHRVEKGTGEEGKDKLFVAVLYSRLDSLVRVSEFVKAPDVLREHFNAEEGQVAKTVYLSMEGVPVKLNPTLEEKIDEAKLLSPPKHILMDGKKVELSKKGDFLPLKIVGDNCDKESVRNKTEDLMLQVVWQQQLGEEDFEKCDAYKAMAIYFKGEEIPTEDKELYRRLKQPRVLAIVEKSKEHVRARKAAYLESHHLVQSLNSSSKTSSMDGIKDGKAGIKTCT